MGDKLKKRFGIWLTVTIIATLFVLISFYYKKGIDCPFYHYFGFYCFLCGCTRSTWAILELNLEAAYNYNPFYFLLLPYCICKYIEMSYRYIKFNEFKITKDMIFLIISAFIFMILRNLNVTNFLIPTSNYPIYTIYPN